MYRCTSIFQCLLLCTLLLAFHRAEGVAFRPRNIRPMPARRQNAQCESATPGVSEDAIIRDACNQNPQNNENSCYNELVVYINESANVLCAHYYALYNNCLMLNNYNETGCLDQKTGYLDCSDYTLQVYAYCGCYYSIPADIYDCANANIEARPSASPNTDTLPTNTILPTLTGPITTSGQSLLTNPPGPTTNTDLTSDNSATGSVTDAPSTDTTPLPSLTILSTPTLPSVSNVIATPTTVRPLTSTTDLTSPTVSTTEVSSATGYLGTPGSRIAVQTTSVGICVLRKRTRILQVV